MALSEDRHSTLAVDSIREKNEVQFSSINGNNKHRKKETH